MPHIRLWFSPGACSLAPHVALREAGIDFEPIEVTFESVSSEFVKLNPKKRIPVLAIDDEIITEIPAIMTAISQQKPDSNLLGRNDLEIVRTYEWMNWLSGTLHGQCFGTLYRPARFTSKPELHKDLQEHAIVTIKECFDSIEHQLSDIHAVGQGFTVVDAYLLVFWRWGNKTQGIDMTDYPRYSALASAVLDRASAKTVMDVERLSSRI
ncbi:glutathione S-transferase [Microthyrium microscopicum]|uniref:Glutathione S-transferase n=1 Tax=Microthyrium microscopicum TaxID=703497 RepID=A0A6A6UF14_9PEZI|nr:glutathione S-transferase [Microthyrium microscopicum]